MKIFENSEREKMKRDREAERRNSRYTESIQSDKTHIKDRILHKVEAVLGENISQRIQRSILSPSKSDIGRRFNIARKSDAARNICPKPSELLSRG